MKRAPAVTGLHLSGCCQVEGHVGGLFDEMGEKLSLSSLTCLPTQKAGGCVRRRGRAENSSKSKGPHRSHKLVGLGNNTEVQRGDCDSIEVT